MIAVLGSFRFPLEAVEQARPLMRAVIEATLAEDGCRAYSYAEDVAEPGLFRVMEQWDSRAASWPMVMKRSSAMRPPHDFSV